VAAAFTLLELVVVLAILAALSAIAVRSLDTVQDQARYDATRQGLDNIQAAVVGMPNGRDTDGSLLVTGFVADIGRLPRAAQVTASGTTQLQLQELWVQPPGLASFTMMTASSDPEVVLGAGWRGNYLRLGVGQTSLADGWGRPYDLLGADGVTPVVNSGDAVFAVRSRGADGLVDTTATSGYDADMVLNFGRYTGVVSGRISQVDSASGQLISPDLSKGPIVVRGFVPDPDTGALREIETVVSPSFTYSFTLTIGPRVLRAYQWPAGTEGPPWSPVTSAILKSVPVRITVQPGGQARDLIIQ
jgi:prepilin-type N-terminal cleavage/methylation domain-containing protein